MERFPFWFPLALLFILALLTFWLDRTVQSPSHKIDGSNRHDMDYGVENFSAMRMSTEGALRYMLAATKMVHYPDDDSTHLTRPHFTSYDKNSAPLHVLAQRGLISSKGQHVYFMGDVKITREAFMDNPPLTVATHYLHIVPDQDIVEGNQAVTIREAKSVLSAVGFHLDNKTRVLKLLSRVKGHYEPPNQ